MMALFYCSTKRVSCRQCQARSGWLASGCRAVGGLMHEKPIGSPDPFAKKRSSEPEIDYSPKTYTFKENLLSFGMTFAIAAFLFALVWVIEKYMFK